MTPSKAVKVDDKLVRDALVLIKASKNQYGDPLFPNLKSFADAAFRNFIRQVREDSPANEREE